MRGMVGRMAALVLIGFVAAGCAGAAVGAGATVGVAAMEERGIGTAASDLKIKATILESWIRLDHTLPTKAGVEVHEGRVLATGMVPDDKTRADAIRLVWQAPGVREVYNEILLENEVKEVGVARDSWITAQLRSKIMADKKVLAINYAIETVAGNIYLIGIAQNQKELDRVVGHARSISYVRQVIPHVRLKEEAAHG